MADMVNLRGTVAERTSVDGPVANGCVDPVALVPGRLHLLGASVPLDDRISWYDGASGRYVPFNTYLVADGDRLLLVEAGVPAVFAAVERQIGNMFPLSGVPSRIAVTRNEPDCVASLPLMVRRFALDTVHSPGLMNTLQFFASDATDLRERAFAHQANELQMLDFGVRCVPALAGEEIAVGPSCSLRIIAAPLRILPTVWLHDPVTRTLFCSDSFADETGNAPDVRLLSTVEPAAALEARFLRSFALKFDWLARSDLTGVIGDLERIFADFDIERLAPNRGLVVSGYRAVHAKQAALLAALRTLQA